MAQLVKNPPAMWETWVRALAREDPLEKGTTIHYSCLENPVDRGAWWATNPLPWGCKELDTTEWLSTRGGKSRTPRPWLSSPVSRCQRPLLPVLQLPGEAASPLSSVLLPARWLPRLGAVCGSCWPPLSASSLETARGGLALVCPSLGPRWNPSSRCWLPLFPLTPRVTVTALV